MISCTFLGITDVFMICICITDNSMMMDTKNMTSDTIMDIVSDTFSEGVTDTDFWLWCV